MPAMYDAIASNKMKSYLLFFFFFIIIIVLSAVFGLIFDWPIGLLALILGVVWGLASYFISDRMVLAISGARPVKKTEFPHVYHSIEGLAIAAGIPTPQMYVIDDTALNAFATGRDPEHSAIVLTTGIIQKMNRAEIEGVIAHEMSHIKNRDVRLMVLSAVMVGVIALLADVLLRSVIIGGSRSNRKNGGVIILIGLFFAILAPISAFLIRMALSRKREYLADANGALLTRYPAGLASALEKIKNDKEPLEAANRATAPMYIANPFKRSSGLSALISLGGAFSTHPPIEERIKKLRMM